MNFESRKITLIAVVAAIGAAVFMTSFSGGETNVRAVSYSDAERSFATVAIHRREEAPQCGPTLSSRNWYCMAFLEAETRKVRAEEAQRAAEAAAAVQAEAQRVAAEEAQRVAEATPTISPAPTKWSEPAPQSDWWPLIVDAANAYGQDPHAMQRVMLCESGGNPRAENVEAVGYEHAQGLFQYLPSTWASTPEGAAGVSIWDGAAQVRMTAWMWAQGRKGEWACR